MAKKIYTINSHGKKIMKEKVINLLSKIEKIVWQVDLGMANICMLNEKETINSFQNYISSIEEHIESYKQLLIFFKKNGYPDSDCALAERPIMHLKIEKKWAEEYIEGVKNGTKTNWNNTNKKL